MSIRSILASAALTAMAVGLSFAAPGAASAQSAPITLCTEDPVAGCVAVVDEAPLVVASDGEAAFHPFGIGFDTSDALETGFNLVPVGGDPAFAAGFWENLGTIDPNHPTLTVWALPASTPCGAENEPACEPVAHWIIPGASFGGGPFSFDILEDSTNGGGVSDIITFSNNVDGVGQLSFASDPLGVPEPAAWALMLAGVGIVGAGLRMGRRQALAVA